MEITELAELLGLPDLSLYLSKVDQALEASIDSKTVRLRDPALRLIRAGGKRLRPILVISSFAIFGKAINESVIECCVAIELTHIATVVHDDIIDNADIRWGIPTVNKQEGMNDAILLGDYLLALAARHAAKVSKEAAQLIASTIATVCDGQSLETVDEFNVDRPIESYLMTIREKTATLISASCQLGGMCAKQPKEQITRLATYGESFGMAYQLVDDLLDFLSTAAALGKPVGNDMKEGVYTMPLLLAMKEQYRNQIKEWLRDASMHPKIITTLLEEGYIDVTLKEVQKYNKKATSAIGQRVYSTVGEGLSKLPDIYLKWALQKQTAVKN